MRSIVLAIFLIVGCSVDYGEAKMTLAQVTNALKPMKKQCLGKVPVSPDLLDSISNGGEVTDDPDLQCYYACLLKAMKVFKDGKVQVDSVLKQIDMMLPADDRTARTKEVVAMCQVQTTSEEPCTNAWQFVKCFYETDRSVCFFP